MANMRGVEPPRSTWFSRAFWDLEEVMSWIKGVAPIEAAPFILFIRY